MAERPLLVLPRPALAAPPKRGGGGSQPHLPTRRTQVGRFAPRFARLREVLNSRTADPMELSRDPTSLAPDRVVVFEIAGSVDDFARGISKVPGFEFMAEYDTEQQPRKLNVARMIANASDAAFQNWSRLGNSLMTKGK